MTDIEVMSSKYTTPHFKESFDTWAIYFLFIQWLWMFNFWFSIITRFLIIFCFFNKYDVVIDAYCIWLKNYSQITVEGNETIFYIFCKVYSNIIQVVSGILYILQSVFKHYSGRIRIFLIYKPELNEILLGRFCHP